MAAAPSRADQVVAKRHYDDGIAQFVLHHYDEALHHFEAGFVEMHEPAFLYNMAQCYRGLGKGEQAIDLFRRYLELRPDAADRSEVDAAIKELVATPPVTAPAPPVVTPPVAGPVDPAVAAPIVKEPPPAPKKHSRAWVWGAVVGGVVIAGGAITLGLVLGAPNVDPVPTGGSIRFGGMN